MAGHKMFRCNNHIAAATEMIEKGLVRIVDQPGRLLPALRIRSM